MDPWACWAYYDFPSSLLKVTFILKRKKWPQHGEKVKQKSKGVMLPTTHPLKPMQLKSNIPFSRPNLKQTP